MTPNTSYMLKKIAPMLCDLVRCEMPLHANMKLNKVRVCGVSIHLGPRTHNSGKRTCCLLRSPVV